jgi:hypothetical protein
VAVGGVCRPLVIVFRELWSRWVMMFDWVPLRGWLLILVGLSAWPAAKYVYRYLESSPGRRDITQPPTDTSWRNGRSFALNLLALIFFAGLAVYIFTRAAEAFARSPSFWPILISGFGGFASFTVIRGLVKGEIEPIERGGSLGPYARDGQPIRYWLTIAWNLALSGFMIWVGLTWKL